MENCAVFKLARRLGVSPDDSALTDALEDAEAELLLYLNREELPAALRSKCVELAAVFYRREADASTGNVKAESYTEGSVSQSQTFQTGAESASVYANTVNGILSSCARYRLVMLKTGSGEQETSGTHFIVKG